jgi:very-short-patch-repair endonuclease
MPDERDKSGRDARIAGLATRQHGVVTSGQLIAIGISTSAITDRVNAGRLHRLHRGVYAVGHRRLSEKGKWMAAVLASGEGAVLSHLSAAELWGIRRRSRRLSGGAGSGGADPVHVSVPGTAGKRRRDGIVLHRTSTLTAADCTLRDGIRVTKPARTLADIHPLLSQAQFNAAVREAEFLKLPIGNLFGGTSRHRGSAAERTRSVLEGKFLALLRRHRLPQPAVNVQVDRFVVDFLWQGQRLIVELDGWQSHRTRSAFEDDRARDARLKVLGYDVLRFTWRHVEDNSAAVARTIRQLLRR